MRTSCESCNRLPSSLVEFNSVMLCGDCFEKEMKRMAAAVIEP